MTQNFRDLHALFQAFSLHELPRKTVKVSRDERREAEIKKSPLRKIPTHTRQ